MPFAYDARGALIVAAIIGSVCLGHLYCAAPWYQTGAFVLATFAACMSAVFVGVAEEDERRRKHIATNPCAYCGRGKDTK